MENTTQNIMDTWYQPDLTIIGSTVKVKGLLHPLMKLKNMYANEIQNKVPMVNEVKEEIDLAFAILLSLYTKHLERHKCLTKENGIELTDNEVVVNTFVTSVIEALVNITTVYLKTSSNTTSMYFTEIGGLVEALEELREDFDRNIRELEIMNARFTQ